MFNNPLYLLLGLMYVLLSRSAPHWPSKFDDTVIFFDFSIKKHKLQIEDNG